MTADPVPQSRRPLDAAALSADVVRPGGLWRRVEVTPRTGSTNTDLAEQARAGAPEGVVVVAEEQTAGRGRRGRTWVSAPHAALTFSILVRPYRVPPARRGWLPLLTGVATATAVRAVAGLDARLKWPNDVLVRDRKLAGILAEQHGEPGGAGDAVVVGIGINVSLGADELPPTGRGSVAATSLLLEGAVTLRRELLLRTVLAEFERWYLPWQATAGDVDAAPAGGPRGVGLRRTYLALCATIGRPVRVEVPDRRSLRGVAADVDHDGRLVIRVGAPGSVTLVRVAAGDVAHVR